MNTATFLPIFSFKTLQNPYKAPRRPRENLKIVPIVFSMVFNLYGVGRTAFGAKVVKKVRKALVVEPSCPVKVE
jgi:hypothetical protein